MRRGLARAEKRLKLNNRGVTLVELIVALLILGIITIPLMGVFTNAANKNRLTRERSSADIVAQNIMEAIKVYGLEGTSKQINTFTPGSGDKCLGVKPDTAYEVSMNGADPEPSPFISYDPTKNQFVQNTGVNVYDFEMTGIREGSYTYSVDIKLDTNYLVAAPTTLDEPEEGATPTPTSVDKNNVTDYDLLAFDQTGTVFINPLSSSVYYDQEALAQIREMNADMIEKIYDSDSEEVARINSEIIENYNAYVATLTTTPTPTMPPLSPYPTKTPVTSLNDMAKGGKVTRNLIIDITKKTEDGITQYVVDSKINYIIPQGSNMVQGDAAGNVIVEKSGFCNKVAIDEDKMKTVYLIYTPYPYMCQSAFDPTYRMWLDTEHTSVPVKSEDIYMTDDMLKNLNNINWDNQEITINNYTDNTDLEIYIIAQAKIGADLSIGSLKTNVNNYDHGKIKVYCQANLTNIGNGDDHTAEKAKDILKPSKEHQDKLIICTVTVTDENGETRTLTSTIQER